MKCLATELWRGVVCLLSIKGKPAEDFGQQEILADDNRVSHTDLRGECE